MPSKLQTALVPIAPVFAAAVLLFPTASRGGGVTLASGGKSDYRIVIPANPLAAERYAAEELQKYLEKISGAKLPITADTERPSSREILLGDNTHLQKLRPKPDWAKLGSDGFVLRTEGNKVIIAGGKPRGTLNGVYTLLEEQFGVRWFTPEMETVPRASRVSLTALNETRVPVLEYREVFWTEMMRDADFAARHRLNGDHYALKEKHGGRFAVYFPFVHSFDLLIPPQLYGEHPEYFPQIDGKRANGYVQRCLSNPEVVKLAKARVREWIKEHPEATILSVSQNDTGNWCQCAACKGLDDAEGSPAASLLRFVNAIAADIEQDFPSVRIDTLAYQYTRRPPKTIRPHRNVIIRLCSIECCFAHPLASCTAEENRRFRDDILAWQPVAPLLYVWDYTPNFANYQQPFPNWDALQPNVQFFAAHGVKGLFEQGNYSPGGFGEMGPLRAYLLAKLLWNPRANLAQHTREFVNAYYATAAPQIHEYLERVEGPVREGKTHAHIFDPPKSGYLDEPFLADADRILSQAEQAATDDTIRFRVAVARLPVWYVQLARGTVAGEGRAKLLQRFLEVARQARISNINESQSLEDWAKQMGAK
jgi:hypothetical protein